MDQLEIDPPYAPETTPNERSAILAEIGGARTNAALRMQHLRGPDDHAVYALIAADLFEELVKALNVQVKTKDHVALFDEIIAWSAIQASRYFPVHPFTAHEIDARANWWRKRFLEDGGTHFSNNIGLAEATHDLGALLDAEAHRLNISHEQLAAKIGISRTTYFDLKAGRGGKRSRRLAQAYLSHRDQE